MGSQMCLDKIGGHNTVRIEKYGNLDIVLPTPPEPCVSGGARALVFRMSDTDDVLMLEQRGKHNVVFWISCATVIDQDDTRAVWKTVKNTF